MHYPRYLGTINLYIDGDLKLEDVPAPETEGEGQDPFCQLLENDFGSGWTETKDSKDGMGQQGMRGWFEYQKGKTVAVFFYRADRYDSLTNDVSAIPKRDDTGNRVPQVGDRVLIIKGHENISPKPRGRITRIGKNGRCCITRIAGDLDIASWYDPPTMDSVTDWENPPEVIFWDE